MAVEYALERGGRGVVTVLADEAVGFGGELLSLTGVVDEDGQVAGGVLGVGSGTDHHDQEGQDDREEPWAALTLRVVIEERFDGFPGFGHGCLRRLGVTRCRPAGLEAIWAGFARCAYLTGL